jgi:hypothetical protein
MILRKGVNPLYPVFYTVNSLCPLQDAVHSKTCQYYNSLVKKFSADTKLIQEDDIIPVPLPSTSQLWDHSVLTALEKAVTAVKKERKKRKKKQIHVKLSCFQMNIWIQDRSKIEKGEQSSKAKLRKIQGKSLFQKSRQSKSNPWWIRARF